jgi:putative zinc finger/helix-turn-helix YgiT family protein
LRDAQRVLPPGTVAVASAVREIVLGLDVHQWEFAQEKDAGWVDVYRVVQEEGLDLWVKLKVELTPQTKEHTVVVSFHAWDDSRPILNGRAMAIDMSETRPHACGGTLRIQAEEGTFRIHNAEIPVTEYFRRCDQCGEELISEDLAQVTEQEAADRYREAERRLAPEDIRALRDRFGLTQELMERTLGLGAKTWVRWETGRIIPNRSMDNLLRLIDRDPTALSFLAELHGVDAPLQFSRGRLSMNCMTWPKSLRDRLGQAASREGTDVNSWLIMTLTRFLDGDEAIRPQPWDVHR